jgi:hypothetical protein
MNNMTDDKEFEETLELLELMELLQKWNPKDTPFFTSLTHTVRYRRGSRFKSKEDEA